MKVTGSYETRTYQLQSIHDVLVEVDRRLSSLITRGDFDQGDEKTTRILLLRIRRAKQHAALLLRAAQPK
jgi:hypothetical protein